LASKPVFANHLAVDRVASLLLLSSSNAAQEAMPMTTPATLLMLSQVQDEAYRYAYAFGDAAVAAAAVAALGGVVWLGLRAFYFLRDMQLAGLLSLRRRAA
jgi:hypothetical protein